MKNRAIFLTLAWACACFAQSRDADFSKLADRYFDELVFRFDPVAGTAAGFHQYDSLLPSGARAEVDAEIAALKKFDTEARDFDPRGLSGGVAADRDLVLSQVRGELLGLERIRAWEKNPDVYSSGVVRPERRVDPAGESPVRVSAGAPGSRLQPSGEIRLGRAECRKPLKEREANQRAATISERCSHVIVSAERCSRGPSRSCRGEGNRQHSGPEGMLDLSGVSGGGTLGQSNAEQERPYLAALSGKDRAYKVGRLKSRGAGRESEGIEVPVKARSKTRWREGSLLWSSLAGGKREGMPETANHPSEKAPQLCYQTMDVCQVARRTLGAGEGNHNRSDAPANGLNFGASLCHARHIKKIIVKPYAGKPHVRFERGFMETGQR